MKQHLLFFDGHCPLCHRAVRYILKHDHKKSFRFAPLDGETALTKLGKEREADSLVFLENCGEESERVFIEGKAVLRICLRLGGPFLLYGWMAYLPGFFFNFLYRQIAKRRYRWFPPVDLPKEETFDGRLLP